MVSVIIPAYNRSRTIERAVKSVLNQTYSDIEVIVVDDCSTDETCDVVRQMKDPRVKLIQLEKNSGACVARNEGIRYAKGALIALQDSDDAWRQTKLQSQMASLLKYNADVVFGKIQRHNYKGEDIQVYPTMKEGIVSLESVLVKSIVSTQTILAKREVFDEVLFDPEMKRRQDYDWAIRAAQKFRLCFVDEILADVYLQDDSISNMEADKYLQNFMQLREKYATLCEKYPRFEESLLRYIIYFEDELNIDSVYEHRRIIQITKNPRYIWGYIRAVFKAKHV